MLDITTLQAFLSVAETASFSRAAEQLHLTQPAVSKRIATLETGLNVRLFDRIGRKVTLTEAGRALLPRARRIVNELNDSRRALSNLSSEVGGRLSIGTSHHIGLHRLPPVLRRYTARYPQVQLDIRFMDSEAACQAVERGDLELGIVTLPLETPASLTSTRVWRDPLRVVVARDHPLARSKVLAAQVLCEHPAILPATGTYTRAIIDHGFAAAGAIPQVSLCTNYLETIKAMVAIGLGWSALPQTLIDAELRPLKVRGIALERSLGVVRHTARTLSNAAAALIALLHQVPHSAQRQVR